jgi:ADP-ribose pyrophosphatase
LYSGRVISLDVDTVRLPGGKIADLEMVRHSGASAVVPFLTPPDSDDPRLLLLRQYRYAADGFVHEIPAGRLHPGEDPATCARRELLEETGCTAARIERLTGIHTTPGFTDEFIHLFIASELERGDPEHEDDEVITLEELPLSYVLRGIERGEITDGKTIVAILFVDSFLRGNRAV